MSFPSHIVIQAVARARAEGAAAERQRIVGMVRTMPDVVMGDGRVIDGTVDRDVLLAQLKETQ